jgi:transcriptional regulator of acetoin/glycerol metabolism
VDSALIERLCLYDWPFNVRELDLVTRQVIALHGDEKKLVRAMLPSRMLGAPSTSAPAVPHVAAAAAAPDIETLLAVLRKHDGNISRASAELGIRRQKAYRLMEAAPRPGAPDDGADPTSPMAKVPMA